MHSKEIDEFAKSVAKDIDLTNCYYLIEATANFFTAQLFEACNGISKPHSKSHELWNTYSEVIQSKLVGSGIILIYLDNGTPEYKVYSHYNKDIYTPYLFDLILKQEFDVEPEDERAKSELTKSIKKEKIKSTLVYACYLNDTDNILIKASNASTTQLNKPFDAITPLGYCAKHNNLPAFKAVLNAGADLSKTTALKETALKHAFRSSPDIVTYIRDDHPEQFSIEIKKQGFSIAHHTGDLRLLQMVLDSGADLNCHKATHPPLHSFADYNNLVGLKFLLENGADITTLNKAKQTVLDRIKKSNRVEAIALLTKFQSK